MKYDLEINDAERNIQVPRCTDITKENEKLDEVKAVSNEDEVHDDKILENNHSNTSESHEDQTEPLNLTTRKTPGDEVSFKNKGTFSRWAKACSITRICSNVLLATIWRHDNFV